MVPSRKRPLLYTSVREINSVLERLAAERCCEAQGQLGQDKPASG